MIISTSLPEILEGILLVSGVSVIAWWISRITWYEVNRIRSHRWPPQEVAVDGLGVGRVTGPRGFTGFGSFFTYEFTVQDRRRVGSFVVIGNEDAMARLQTTLQGVKLRVHYNPGNPDESFLDDPRDSRPGGVIATQDPQWLEQAPPNLRLR